MFCASVAYPTQPGGRFDFAYFAHTYAPLFARLLGANCVRYAEDCINVQESAWPFS